MKNEPYSAPERLVSLDALRGIGAIIIAFMWHYRHFIPAEKAPFYSILKPLFDQGTFVVELFFLLSGFVMALCYKNKILDNKISFGKYIVRRIKHIYPLMLVTLIAVTLEQAAFLAITGKTFIYKCYDVYHFVLNLLCIQSGWVENKFSFNGPAWCISVELICYILLFFLLYLARKNKMIYYAGSTLLALLGLCCVVENVQLPFLHEKYTARGLLCFFGGCLLFELYSRVSKKLLGGVSAALVAASVVMMVLHGYYGIKLWGDLQLSLSLLVFPSLIIAAVTIRPLKWVLSIPPLVFLGKISMPIYLVHFPVQLLIVLIDRAFSLNMDFSRVYSMAVYVGVTFVVAIAVHLITSLFNARARDKVKPLAVIEVNEEFVNSEK